MAVKRGLDGSRRGKAPRPKLPVSQETRRNSANGNKRARSVSGCPPVNCFRSVPVDLPKLTRGRTGRSRKVGECTVVPTSKACVRRVLHRALSIRIDTGAISALKANTVQLFVVSRFCISLWPGTIVVSVGREGQHCRWRTRIWL